MTHKITERTQRISPRPVTTRAPTVVANQRTPNKSEGPNGEPALQSRNILPVVLIPQNNKYLGIQISETALALKVSAV